MIDPSATIALLPHRQPACPNARLALFAIRRMGAYGLDDAHAAHAMFTGFGQGFRRPLLLLRALMTDLAASAVATIAIAPCCCTRITAAEAGLLAILAKADVNPAMAHALMTDLLGCRHAHSASTAAAAVAAAFADGGRPIAG